MAYRSKDIQKQEKHLSDKLKRKRIQLESPKFNLMDVLHQSLLIAAGKNQARPQQNQVAQKMKPQGVSDHLSISPSTTGTRSTMDLRQHHMAAMLRRERSEIQPAHALNNENAAAAAHISDDGGRRELQNKKSDSDVSDNQPNQHFFRSYTKQQFAVLQFVGMSDDANLHNWSFQTRTHLNSRNYSVLNLFKFESSSDLSLQICSQSRSPPHLIKHQTSKSKPCLSFS